MIRQPRENRSGTKSEMASTDSKYIHIYDAGLLHPPSPRPMVSPPGLSSGYSLLVWPCCFPRLPGWSRLALSPPSPVEWGLWSFLLAPSRLWGAVCSTEVWYGCCRLLVVSSLRALSPPPRCRVGPVVFLVGPGGSVFYRGMAWLLPLVSSNVIFTCSLPYYKI